MRVIVLLSFCLTFFCACEENFEPPTTFKEQIVVEGYVEAYYPVDDSAFDELKRPAFVILTKTVPFNASFSQTDFENLFVHSAVVAMSENDNQYQLTEICLNDLNEQQRAIAIQSLGLDQTDLALFGFDFQTTNFCAYVDNFERSYQSGATYELTIKVNNKTLTASTTIPFHNPIDAIQFSLPPGDSAFFSSGSLRQMQISLDDRFPEANYYRYFTKQNNHPTQKGNAALSGFKSILEDKYFSDPEASISLLKGEPRDSTFNTGGNNFGNYNFNDEYLIKWCNIDRDHFDFWNVTEANALNQGLFSTYAQPPSNIEGGIGIWGGASVSFYRDIVPQ